MLQAPNFYPQDDEDQEPPDDFRELSYCPTAADFVDMEKPFLPMMKDKGSFDSTH